jgi:hypothetical protein
MVGALDEVTDCVDDLSVRCDSCAICQDARQIGDATRTAQTIFAKGPERVLSGDQMATRIKCSRSLLTILRAQETRAWHDILTLDGLWF